MPSTDSIQSITYRVKREYEGLYYVYASDETRHVASVGRFMPGPMVHVRAPSITSPALARAIARAMTRLANELDRDAAR